MSAAFTIYNAAKIEIETAHHETRLGWIVLTVTEADGAEHEITIHFETRDGYAAAKQLAHIMKAINAKEPA